jgi:hypothetical protein
MNDRSLRQTYSPSAIVGSTLAGAMFGIVLSLVQGGFIEAGSEAAAEMLLPAAVAGGVCAAILLPSAISVLLARVPAWRALVVTSMGATVGATLAYAFTLEAPLTALGAALGFVLSTLSLRSSARPPTL